MKKPKFPEFLNVTQDPNGTEDDDFMAFRTVEKSVDGDGPTYIAEYKLVRVRRFRKVSEEVK